MYLVDNKDVTHGDVVNKSFIDAKEVTICVAFIKQSGFYEIRENLVLALKKGTAFTVFAGLDFYLTEPSTLRNLLELSIRYKNMNLYLCEERRATFHPKLYFSIFNNKASLLIGSANLTKGGLETNNEVSIYQEADIDSKLVMSVRRFLDSIRNQKGTQKANKLNISQYRRKCILYNKQVKKAQKNARKEISESFQLDLTKLDRYLKEYRTNDKVQTEWDEKVRNYRKAKRLLDEMTTDNVSSRKEFLTYYEQLVGAAGQKRLWDSGSLFRLRKKVANKYKTFLDMVRAIRNITASNPREQFEEGMKFVKKINGLGVNALTEILNTYVPRKCSVLNNNPISSLNYLGFEKFKPPNTFKGDDYEKYNDIMEEFAISCDFKNLSQVDHFLNYIYWKYVKHG